MQKATKPTANGKRKFKIQGIDVLLSDRLLSRSTEGRYPTADYLHTIELLLIWRYITEAHGRRTFRRSCRLIIAPCKVRNKLAKQQQQPLGMRLGMPERASRKVPVPRGLCEIPHSAASVSTSLCRRDRET